MMIILYLDQQIMSSLQNNFENIDLTCHLCEKKILNSILSLLSNGLIVSLIKKKKAIIEKAIPV